MSRSQRELLKQKEEFEAIFRYSKNGIAILDLELKFIDFNRAYLKMLGYSSDEVYGKNFVDIISLEERSDISSILYKIKEDGYVDNLEKVCIGKDGKRISTSITITLMPDKIRLLLSAKDITSTKLLESQAKLASMGEMIGNIAHQWRQPLSIITTSASGMSLKAEEQESISSKEIVDFSTQIIYQAQYLSKTIDDFRNFIRDDLQYKDISIKDALLNSLSITKATIRSNYITIISDINDDITIRGNKNELSQAFINIINNAKDKLKEMEQSKQKRYLFISTKLVDKNLLLVKILDNGGGIKRMFLSRIFEPYLLQSINLLEQGLDYL